MTKIFRLNLPDGTVDEISYDEQTDKAAIAEKYLAAWGGYIERNWLSNDHEDRMCGENRVKRFMESISAFILMGDTSDTITEWGERKTKQCEVLIPMGQEGALYGVPGDVISQIETAPPAFTQKKIIARQKRFPEQGSFSRIEAFKRENPHAVFSFYHVDTEGCFTAGGSRYRISDEVKEYKGKKTKSGLRYDMDRIIVVTKPNGEKAFLNQWGYDIPQDLVTEIK